MPCNNGCTKCDAPDGPEWSYGDVFVKQIAFPGKHAVGLQHSHEYDHLTLVASGAVDVWQDGFKMGTYRAPATIPIAAGVQHGFEALEDDTVLYCVHNLHGAKGPLIKGA